MIILSFHEHEASPFVAFFFCVVFFRYVGCFFGSRLVLGWLYILSFSSRLRTTRDFMVTTVGFAFLKSLILLNEDSSSLTFENSDWLSERISRSAATF